MRNVSLRFAALLAAASTLGVTGCSANFNNPANKPIPTGPVVVSVSPPAGPVAGNTPVTITGANFFGTVSVTLGNSQCLNPIRVSDSTIRCTTFAHGASAVDVVVTAGDGQTGTLPSGYTYQIAPVPILVTPAGGPLTGGSTVTVMGVGFVGGAMVTLGGNTCANVNVLNATTLTCMTLPHAGGSVPVTVTNSDAQFGSLSNAFTYEAGPALSAITPTAGALVGGTSVTITGSNILAGFTVDLGGSPCNINNLATVLPTTIVCTSTFYASAAAIAVNVNVHNPDGQLAAIANGYTYQPAPSVSAIALNAGALAGGNSVTVTGTNFLNGASVSLGATPCAVTASAPPTSITCTAGNSGFVTATPVNVVVLNPDTQTGTLANGYKYEPAPAVTTITPNSGPAAGGTQVTIAGSNFVTGLAVSVGGSSCGVTSVTASQIICSTTSYVTAASATVGVTVTNPDTQTSAATPLNYTYVPAPAITSISPYAGGALGGGTVITIVGTNFLTVPANPTATVGGVSCPVSSATATSVVCTTPNSLSGVAVTRPVVVTNPDTQVSNSFNFRYEPAPTVGSITPYPGGAINGGNLITINGSNFLTGATVTIGASACTAPTVSASSISCTVPSLGTTGTKAVVVLNPDQQNSSGTPYNYVYENAPAVASITPYPGGVLTGGNNITVNGSNFMTGATVAINGVSCPVAGAPAPTSTLMVCTVPNSGSGTPVNYNLVVTNPDLQTSPATLYHYENPPGAFTVSPASGPTAGGTAVTITGTGGNNFITGATVSFGGSACTVGSLTATQITCTTTAYVAATATAVNVTITNLDGQATTVNSVFTYVPPPNVTAITPAGATAAYAGGPQGGLNAITITGTNFLTAPSNPTVTVGGLGCTVTAATATSITCTVPAPVPAVTGASTAAKAVVVTNADGQTNAATPINYTYEPAPTYATAAKYPVGAGGPYAGGPLVGSNQVTITGTGFITAPLPTVAVGTYACTVSQATATTILCTMPNLSGTPAAPGAVAIKITNADAQSITQPAAYTFNGVPTVTGFSINPGNFAGGPIAGGNTITIAGTGFLSSLPTYAPTVVVAQAGNNYNCVVSAASATAITCAFGALAPVPSAGVATLTVTNPDGQAAAGTTYTFVSPPTITSLTTTPGSYAGGPLNGGNTISITGTNFIASPLPTVKIGIYTCTTSSATTTYINCALGAALGAAPGAVNVVVTNADNEAVTSVNGYTFEAAPTIASIRTAAANYAGGPLAGNTAVTITGTGFINATGTLVDFNNAGTHYTCPASSISATTIACTIQAIAGLVALTPANVSVTNADNQATGTIVYNFEPAPAFAAVSPNPNPNAGPATGGTAISVVGTGSTFINAAGLGVTIGGAACTALAFVDANHLTCNTPSGTGGTAGNVVITNPDGQTATLVNGFSWASPPNLEWQIGAAPPYTYQLVTTDTVATGYTTNVDTTYVVSNQGGSTSGTPTVYLSGTNEQLKGDLTTGSTSVANLTTTSGIYVGMGVSGTGIQATTTVTAVTTSTVTLSLAATATAAQTVLTFSNLQLTGTTTNASNQLTGLASTTNLAAGMYVDGPGVPDGAKIFSIVNATTVQLDSNANASATAGGNFTFSKNRLFMINSNGCTGTVGVSGSCNIIVRYLAGQSGNPGGTFSGVLNLSTTAGGGASPAITMTFTRSSGYTWQLATIYATSTIAVTTGLPVATNPCYQENAIVSAKVVDTAATGTQVSMTAFPSQNNLCNGTGYANYFGLTGCVRQCGGGTTPAYAGTCNGVTGDYPSSTNGNTCSSDASTVMYTAYNTGAAPLTATGCDTSYRYIVQNYTCK